MAQSIFSLSSAMFSFNQIQTMNSVQKQIQGQSNVLEKEIASGNGNIEAKQKKLEENEQKNEALTERMNKSLGGLQQEMQESAKPKDPEELLEEKLDEKKAEQTQNESTKLDTVQIEHINQDVQTEGIVVDVVSDAVLTYDAAGNAMVPTAEIGANLNVIA